MKIFKEFFVFPLLERLFIFSHFSEDPAPHVAVGHGGEHGLGEDGAVESPVHGRHAALPTFGQNNISHGQVRYGVQGAVQVLVEALHQLGLPVRLRELLQLLLCDPPVTQESRVNTIIRAHTHPPVRTLNYNIV